MDYDPDVFPKLPCPECVTALRGPLYLVVDQFAHDNLTPRLGVLYTDKLYAIKARDPGEVVVELRLADNG